MESRVFYGFKLTAPLNIRSTGFWHRTLIHTELCGFDGIPTVRFGDVMYTTVRFGAVFRNRKNYGAVRCGFRIS